MRAKLTLCRRTSAMFLTTVHVPDDADVLSFKFSHKLPVCVCGERERERERELADV